MTRYSKEYLIEKQEEYIKYLEKSLAKFNGYQKVRRRNLVYEDKAEKMRDHLEEVKNLLE